MPTWLPRRPSQADRAQETFENQLQLRGRQVLENVREDGGYAVVIASRPYHNDPLVNHGLPKLFSERGIPVLTPDAVRGSATSIFPTAASTS